MQSPEPDSLGLNNCLKKRNSGITFSIKLSRFLLKIWFISIPDKARVEKKVSIRFIFVQEKTGFYTFYRTKHRLQISIDFFSLCFPVPNLYKITVSILHHQKLHAGADFLTGKLRVYLPSITSILSHRQQERLRLLQNCCYHLSLVRQKGGEGVFLVQMNIQLIKSALCRKRSLKLLFSFYALLFIGLNEG